MMRIIPLADIALAVRTQVKLSGKHPRDFTAADLREIQYDIGDAHGVDIPLHRLTPPFESEDALARAIDAAIRSGLPTESGK